MGSEKQLDDCSAFNLVVPASVTTSAGCSTPSGSWQDTENCESDVLVIVQVGLGTFTSIAIQVQCSAANTGASAVNVVDPRGTSFSITVAGVYILAVDSDKQSLDFIGITSTFVGTSVLFSAVLVTRPSAWSSGAAI